jgi:hypothetical protein
MARNSYFNQYSTSTEQNTLENLLIESIKIYGVDVYYIPRVTVAEDQLYDEDYLNEFQDGLDLEMYIKSVDGFEGSGDFLSKFGIQIEDQVTFSVAKTRFEQEVSDYTLAEVPRPREGDLIWFPMTRDLFEIKFVEHEELFYQLGKLYTYEIRCEKFQYSSETIDTGISDIDSIEDNYSLDINSWGVSFSLEDDSGRIIQEDDTLLLLQAEAADVTIKNFDPEADNEFINDRVRNENIIDFSESNPFSEGF